MVVVTSGRGDPFAPVFPAPPSTGTTEYVALLSNGSSCATPRFKNGREEPKEKSDEAAKSAEVWTRILVRIERKRQEGVDTCCIIAEDVRIQKEKGDGGYDTHHNIRGYGMVERLDILVGGWCFDENSRAGNAKNFCDNVAHRVAARWDLYSENILERESGLPR